MKKLAITLFTVVSAIAPLFGVQAAPYITYPDFVLMDQEGRYEVVHMMQDYVTEYEAQSRLYMESQSKKSAYINLEFLINSAYAASAAHGAPCMYGGWLSVMQESNGQVYCNNPRKYGQAIKRFSSSDQGFKEDLIASQNLYSSHTSEVSKGNVAQISYTMDGNKLNININTSKPKCNIGGGAILCNPLLYGKLDGKVMCVPGDGDHKGYNSSFLCERAVNKIKETEPEKYKQLMDGIIKDAMKDKTNQRLFLHTLKDMYDMCMCSQDQDESGQYKNGRINKFFSDKMFFTRTCAGVLYQSQTILSHVGNNQSSSCGVFTEVVSPEEDWLKFARQASQNIRIETKNLRRDFVQRLEVKLKEEKDIELRRRQALQERGGEKFCPIDIEEPKEEEIADPTPLPEPPKEPEEVKSCEIAGNYNEDGSSIQLSFNPAPGTKFEDYSFQPTLEFKADENGVFKASFLPANSSEDLIAEEAAISASEEAEEKEGATPKRATASFIAKLGEQESCSTQVSPPEEEVPPKEDGDSLACKMELSVNDADEGSKIEAKVTIDGEKPSEEHDVKVVFENITAKKDSKKEKRETASDEDEMIDDKPVGESDEEDQERSKGKKLKPLKDNPFAVMVKGSEKDQKIKASLSGSSCPAASKTITVKGKKKPAAEAPRTGPAMRQPNLMQPRPRRGFLMRGNR